MGSAEATNPTIIQLEQMMNAFLIKHGIKDGDAWTWQDMGIVVGNTYLEANDKAETFIANMKLIDADKPDNLLHKYYHTTIKVLP